MNGWRTDSPSSEGPTVTLEGMTHEALPARLPLPAGRRGRGRQNKLIEGQPAAARSFRPHRGRVFI